MNRRQKIIVSVTGIFLVLLILVGLTYAFFITRIRGNNNPTSISVTTANLELVYEDDTNEVIGDEKLEPSNRVFTKEFTVTNNGNVNINYGVYLIDVINTFERKDDIKYTLTCSTTGSIECGGKESTTFPSGISELITNEIEPQKTHTYTFSFTYKDTGTDQSVDMGKELSAKIQIFGENGKGVIIPHESNSLAYSVINRAFNSKIEDMENGKTVYMDNPISTVAEEVSGTGTGVYDYEIVSTSELVNEYYTWRIGDTPEAAKTGDSVTSYNEAVNHYVYDNYVGWTKYLESYDETNSTLTFRLATEKVLSKTEDDYGTSYYYRGNVEDNYVNFAGMCWRIVRIQGDGSTKLILEDQYTTCDDKTTSATDTIKYNGNWAIPKEFGDSDTIIRYGGKWDFNTNKSIMNYLQPYYDSSAMAKAFYDFQTNNLSEYLDKLKIENWCLADTAYSRSGESSPYTYTKLSEYNHSTDMYYDSYVRLSGDSTSGYKPTLKCTGTKLNKFLDLTYDGETIINSAPMYVGALTADEIVYAGGKVGARNINFYLINNYQKSNYTSKLFWTLSPGRYIYGSDTAFVVALDSDINELDDVRVTVDFISSRPSVSLKSNIPITNKGDGTIDNPYEIEA